jgi:hypothetical protein
VREAEAFYFCQTTVKMRCKKCGIEEIREGRLYFDGAYNGPVTPARLPKPKEEDE